MAVCPPRSVLKPRGARFRNCRRCAPRWCRSSDRPAARSRAGPRSCARANPVAFVEADVTGEKGLATRCAFAFGAERASVFERTFAPTPSMPGPEACETYIPEGLGPSFANHFETRLAKGARPGTGADEHDHFIWVRHKDDAADSVVALLALADMPPPAVMPMFKEFAPISSMTWMVNLLTENPQDRRRLVAVAIPGGERVERVFQSGHAGLERGGANL